MYQEQVPTIYRNGLKSERGPGASDFINLSLYKVGMMASDRLKDGAELMCVSPVVQPGTRQHLSRWCLSHGGLGGVALCLQGDSERDKV